MKKWKAYQITASTEVYIAVEVDAEFSQMASAVECKGMACIGLEAKLKDCEEDNTGLSEAATKLCARIEHEEGVNSELRERVQVLRGALADIAFSADMTLETARAKAKRIYESMADAE